MKFRIEYALGLEILRVQETVQKLNWYKENNYTVLLPLNIVNEETITPDAISRIVSQEYSNSSYLSTEQYIQGELKKTNIERQLGDLALKYKLTCPQEVMVQLTKYGTKGSYNPPNIIILHIKQKRPLMAVILHEAIHLLIHSDIEKYNISHWHKEALVDFLFKQVFPEFSFQQSIKDNYVMDIKNIFLKNEKLNLSEKIKKLSR